MVFEKQHICNRITLESKEVDQEKKFLSVESLIQWATNLCLYEASQCMSSLKLQGVLREEMHSEWKGDQLATLVCDLYLSCSSWTCILQFSLNFAFESWMKQNSSIFAVRIGLSCFPVTGSEILSSIHLFWLCISCLFWYLTKIDLLQHP